MNQKAEQHLSAAASHIAAAELLPGGFVVVPHDEHLSMIGPFEDPPAAISYGEQNFDGFQIRFIEEPE